MSLIIAYVGNKGCVMVGDKRRIAYFGSKEERELLEQEIYSGDISSDEDLYARAEELEISLKISDDACKVKSLENVAVGEVSSRGAMETKRKRIYGTTNGFQIVELTGSEIVNVKRGESSIIVFGNKITKSLANDMLKNKWKPSFSLKYMGEIFGQIIEDISTKTPSLGTKYDVVIQQNNLSKTKVQDYLDEVIERDINLLAKFRNKLKEDLLKQNETIKLASTIIDEGPIGIVDSIDENLIQVKLNPDVRAFDINWKLLAKPGENVIMFVEGEDAVSLKDQVVIENEALCIKGNKANLKCDIILCHLE
ncbi:DUF2121 family protein [Methanobrevibacter olleyae]|uniref:DUF2121 domain-containing protein n=1 Tax=Methanobrevibacter olleyae TaxID=294671 RepID=A0A126R0N8_METOL|nr:DUF2121 domain-containing protein [Methanobrevibacter olleyae]AMK15606.1 hypothetical protein YLM1_1049 [Methanobrevibacter olleyae]SFL73940.1 hypothetical protein SAMN02910297_01640 [Methanobrevibacter olleyae]